MPEGAKTELSACVCVCMCVVQRPQQLWYVCQICTKFDFSCTGSEQQ